jgi:transcriptional regulator with XRE-family HTH domain
VRKPVEVETGRALRKARLANGLTLREVGERSGGTFTPTAVAGYERAERSISLERFYALCAFYGVAPDRLLADIVDVLERERVIILTDAEADVDIAAAEVDVTPVDVPDPSGV